MTITVAQLETLDTKTVWCLNTTRGNKRGEVVFTVPKLNGNVGLDTISVPASFLPFELTSRVHKNQLINSSEFRRAVSSGAVSIIDNNEAESLLQEDGAEEEVARLKKNEELVDATINSIAMASNIQVDDKAGKQQQEAELAKNANMASVNAQIIELVTRSNGGESSQTILNSLRSMGALTQQEYEFIVKEAKDSKIKKFAASKIQPV